MKNFNYTKYLRKYASDNRQKMTKSEACMWKYVLSKRQMVGYQFRRQRPIDNYIADFVCLPLGLVIEVDGITHDSEVAKEKDARRDEKLHSLGFTTLRFSSWEVLQDIDRVTSEIRVWIEENAKCPPPGPRQRGK